tara:strand:+ start:211 stop:501 length:291 start_codon:yes stop_codon:yes gene_type:complete
MKKKFKTKDEKQWLNKMSEFGCCICKRYHDVIDAPPATLHHIREGMGMGQKNTHFMVLPVCFHHHLGKDGFHTSPKTWIEKYGKESEMLKWVLDNL